ncbi:TonB-dependent receptor domain-containing protein [Aurantiacibacter gilvus]|uniref:TonB-dependent receptor n=1 Tax=Aurantiacibacter gilvus TaxID=3139141 RepID=A0ABU9IB64_9SPHN
MKTFQKNTLYGLAASVSAVALFAGAPAAAQEVDCDVDPTAEECDDVVSVTDDGVSTVSEDEAIVVTGTRVRRDTYTSISPLQVLTTEAERDVGEFDAAQILQRSEAAAGVQIDATFQGFVLDNGPGSQTLNLRGLGADRTLLLVNGRRLAPAGVEGAPSAPSINLLPTSLIARYDLLLDGASSVYGSDAVAGVGNIVLRQDFDGLELFASGNLNEQSNGGHDFTVSGAYGIDMERGFIGIGAEYSYRDEVTFGDRDFLSGCSTHYEVTDSGEIRTLGLRDNATVMNRTPGVSVAESPCVVDGISGRLFNAYTRFGSVYFPANGNIANIPGLGYGESTDAFGVDLDTNGDGIRDVDFQNVNTNGSNLDESLISQQKLYNVMAYGEYQLTDDDYEITPFFEANYSRAEISSDNTGIPQLFPYVSDFNAFNPCNFVTGTGVDCRDADNQLQQLYPGQANFGRLNPLSTGFALPVQPIVAIAGDRNNFDIVQEQYRGVLGIRGNLPFIDDTWTFELSGVYSRSEGSSVRRGIREDRLALALGIDPTADFDGDGIVDNDGDGTADDYDPNYDVFTLLGDTQYIGECNGAGLANPDLAAPDLNAGSCVPVNMFAPSVMTGAIGDFATQAERDYVFGVRSFDTTYEQFLLSFYATGEVLQLPAGPVSLVVGGEYREDSIESLPDLTASQGLFFGFFADQGAVGSKYIVEGFGELDVPVFDSETWGQFDLNVSGRVTEEEFYGTAGTYSIKAGWRIIPSVLVKASYGTSFRAPNLRENFLAGQSGFLTLFDPCAVPAEAFNAGAGGYQANLDTRDQAIIANCQREGRDPFTVGIDNQGLNTLANSSVEITSGGSLDLNPETSRSLTVGLSVAESYGDLDFAFNFNYYDIKIEGSIVEPSSQFIINDCFTRQDGIRSPFCDRIDFDTAATSRMLVSDVAAGFINLNEEVVKGIDMNANFDYGIPMGGEVLELGLNLRANHLIERSTLFIDDTGVPSLDEDQGEFGFPGWTGRATFTAGYGPVTFTWQTRYIGDTEQQADGIDPLDDAFGNLGTGFLGDTCTGNGTANVPGDGVFCRDIGYADEYFVHTASVRYEFSDWLTLRAGVTNVFDTDPPLIDCNEPISCRSNTPLGNGYDLNGREFFGSVNMRF